MSDSAAEVAARKQPPRSLTVGRLRLYSGLVIFLYCIFHFVNHATGIFLVDTMEAARAWIMPLWRGLPGQIILYGALLTHAGLSLYALYRRRHLRMPAFDALQLGLGVMIPVLIMEHIVNARIAETVFGISSTYHRLLLAYWVDSPWRALQMAILLIVVWGHACLGLHFWLRYRGWYTAHVRTAVALAVLIPALSLAGLVASGVSLAADVAADPAYAERIREAANAGDASELATLQATERWLILTYLAIVVLVLIGREIREWRAKRLSPVRLRYLSGPDIIVAPGLSILEASRFAGIPHQSMCGGRGRCSTCRVRIVEATSRLPDPSATEKETLARIKAGPGIRLACQLRPLGTVTFQTLVPAEDTERRHPELESLVTGREIDVAALFIDLRRSTELAAEKLPYDALFIVDRYLDVVVGAVREHNGHLTSIAGDGVMALFGLHGDIARASREAVLAARAIWRGIERLNTDLEQDLPWPLRFGIGVHAGISIVGISNANATSSVQFLGDTGNIASRLEGVSKKSAQPIVFSQRVVRLAGIDAGGLDQRSVEIDGQRKPLNIVAVQSLEALETAIGETEAEATKERGIQRERQGSKPRPISAVPHAQSPKPLKD